jgi:hypothetical protein
LCWGSSRNGRALSACIKSEATGEGDRFFLATIWAASGSPTNPEIEVNPQEMVPSVRRNVAAACVWIISLQNERQGEHNKGGNSEHPKGVDVGQGGGLSLNRSVNSSQGLPLRFMQAQSSMGQLLSQAVDRILKS